MYTSFGIQNQHDGAKASVQIYFFLFVSHLDVNLRQVEHQITNVSIQIFQVFCFLYANLDWDQRNL